MADGRAELSARLSQAARDRAEAEQVDTLLAEQAPVVQQAAERLKLAEEQLQKENDDVERLRSLSFARMLAAIRRTTTDDLDRESEEARAAAYAFGIAQHRHAEAEHFQAQLSERRSRLGDAARRYAEALAAKQECLVSTPSVTASRLTEAAERRGELQAVRDELQEAKDAIATARAAVADAAQDMYYALHGATYDAFGASSLDDYAKYHYLDRAAEGLATVGPALARVRTQIADLRQVMEQARIEQIDPTLATFDLFFDDIVTAMLVRREVRESQDRVKSLDAPLRAAYESVKERLKAADDELLALDKTIEELVVDA